MMLMLSLSFLILVLASYLPFGEAKVIQGNKYNPTRLVTYDEVKPHQNYSEEFISRFQRNRKLLINSQEPHRAHHHSMPWKGLEEVDGLKNSEVVVFVASSTVDHGKFLWQRVIPSARTWMRMFKNVFVLVEDNIPIRYSLRNCIHHEFPNFTTFECPHEPTYLLTRRCTKDYYVWKGICCKIDEMFHFLVNENIELFQSIKYLLQVDDDTYLRGDLIMKWLAGIENSGFAHLPLIANNKHTDIERRHSGGIWHVKGCKEIHDAGWNQPIMLNAHALKKMRIASAAHGLTDTCRNFDVSQDVGLEIYMWFFGLYHIYWPGVEINGGHVGTDIFNPLQLAVHALKQDHDNCNENDQHLWPNNTQYQQRLAIGCGDIDHPSPFHDSKKQASMYDAWEYFREKGQNITFGVVGGEDEWYTAKVTIERTSSIEMGKFRVKEILPKNAVTDKDGKYNGEAVYEKAIPLLQYIAGYNNTKHGQQYDIINKEWKAFTLQDCNPPGSIDHR